MEYDLGWIDRNSLRLNSQKKALSGKFLGTSSALFPDLHQISCTFGLY